MGTEGEPCLPQEMHDGAPTIIDYIVVHELCHFRHPDHAEAFWNEVDKVMPQYRERKEWLRKNGASMDV
jgi:predicted metal-dependent hydrolase